MAPESYTLREVAELLGVSKRTLQRRIREGAFPGRFLAPGPHGLETRVPTFEVHAALQDFRKSVSPEPRLPTVIPTRTLQESRAPLMSGLTQVDLEMLRDAMLAMVREDRERFLTEVRRVAAAPERELARIRTQLEVLTQAIAALRPRLDPPTPAPPRTVDSHDRELDRVLRELQEIEALVGVLEN